MAEQNESTAVVEKKTWEVCMVDALSKYCASYPERFSIDRFVANLYAVIVSNPDLKKYGSSQVVAGAKTAATLGLDFLAKEAYLVPYGSTLQCQVSYKGDTKLAKLHSVRPMKDIQGYIIREGDEFQMWQESGETKYLFKPLPCNDTKIIGAFAVAIFKDGGLQVEVMNRTELDATRNASKAKQANAWQKFSEEMYRKCVIKRLCKHIDLEWDNPEQAVAWQEDGAINTQETVKVEKAPFADDNVIEGNGVLTDA